MSWRVFGETLNTADLTSPNKYQAVIPNDDIILIAARTWIIFYNNPTVTNLGMKIYSNDNGAPGKLLATSNVLTKAEIITLANGCREVPFTFNNFNMRATDTYHFSLFGAGYTDGWPSAGLSWRKGWPDPVYTTNVVTTYTSVGVSPYALYLVGAEL